MPKIKTTADERIAISLEKLVALYELHLTKNLAMPVCAVTLLNQKKRGKK